MIIVCSVFGQIFEIIFNGVIKIKYSNNNQNCFVSMNVYSFFFIVTPVKSRNIQKMKIKKGKKKKKIVYIYREKEKWTILNFV